MKLVFIDRGGPVNMLVAGPFSHCGVIYTDNRGQLLPSVLWPVEQKAEPLLTDLECCLAPTCEEATA